MSLSRMICMSLTSLALVACSDTSSAPTERPTLSVIPTPAPTSAPSAPMPTPAPETVHPNSNTDGNSAQTTAPTARYAPTPGMPSMAYTALVSAAYGMCKARALGPDHPASELSQKLATVLSGNVEKSNALMLGQLRTIAADRMQCKPSDMACQQQAQEQAHQILNEMHTKKQQGAAQEDVLIAFLGEDKERLCK